MIVFNDTPEMLRLSEEITQLRNAADIASRAYENEVVKALAEVGVVVGARVTYIENSFSKLAGQHCVVGRITPSIFGVRVDLHRYNNDGSVSTRLEYGCHARSGDTLPFKLRED